MMNTLSKTARYFCAALVLTSALASCGSTAVTQPPSQTVQTKSQAVQAFERIATQKGFTGQAVFSDVTDGTATYKVATLERNQGSSVETLVALEQKDGQFQIVSITAPSKSDEVNVNAADLITVSTLNNEGKTTDTKRLSDLGIDSEVTANVVPIWVWRFIAFAAWRVLAAYGKQYSCDFINDKIRQRTGWNYSKDWNTGICAIIGL